MKNTLIVFAIFLIILCGLIVKVASKENKDFAKPNIILITLDTVRADHLGCYGYKNIHTPNLDFLARQGVLFEKAITSAPITLPAHASILTGKYPYEINVRNNGTYLLQPDSITIATELKKTGYSTAAFISAAVLVSFFNLNQGFDIYDQELNQRKMATGDFTERDASSVTTAAIKWMKQHQKEPFFAWIHYFDPHTAYQPPEPFKTNYKDNLYDGEIAYVDSQIDHILAFINEQMKKEKTFLVITVGDHGEGLWDHGEPEHGIF